GIHELRREMVTRSRGVRGVALFSAISAAPRAKLVDARSMAWHDDWGCSAVHSPSLQLSSVARMWSATRSAWAAMVSAGLTAAEDGMKPASTTNRFWWSKARQ